MVTIVCYIPAGRYRTERRVLKLSLTAAWQHISSCQHGHEMK